MIIGLNKNIMLLNDRCKNSIWHILNIKLCEQLALCFLFDTFYFGVFSSTKCTKCGY